MTADDVETLLKPISAEQPCGADLEYAPEFLQLQELARGKPEQVIGDKVRAAQEPSWPKVREESEALFGATKDLRVAGILHCALLKTAGVAGLETSLAVIHGLLERYWDHLYPPLDAEDDNDPTFRVNCLVSSLAGEESTAALRQMTIVESRQFGRHSLRQYRIATGVLQAELPPETTVQQELARFEAAIGDVDLQALKASAAAAAAAAAHLNGIEKILLEKAGGIPEELTPLRSDVKDLDAIYSAQLVKRGEVTPGGEGATSETGSGASTSAVQVTGGIRNRKDVVHTLDALCEYYARHEPSSPIPLLLQRAKRLVDKGFMDIMRDLAPGGVAEAEVIGGLEKKDT
jgi:type VI secretion system protein ImpA